MWGEHMNMDWWWGWGGFHMVGYLLISIVLVAAVVWLVGRDFGRGPGEAGSALDILNERYARGEIGKEEFEQKKRDLRE